MKNIFFLFFLLLIAVNGQEKEITQLENTKNHLLKKITELKDSIKIIDKRMAFIKSYELKKILSDSTLTGVVKKNAKLRKEPEPVSKIILTLKEGQTVTVLDYHNGYFGACTDSICGYVNEIWIKLDDKLRNFIKLKIAEERELRRIVEEKSEAEKIALEMSYKKKFGLKTYAKLKNGYYWIGMTEEMAFISLGNPKDINKSVGVWGVHEQWVYDDLYLYFENGKLTSYQN